MTKAGRSTALSRTTTEAVWSQSTSCMCDSMTEMAQSVLGNMKLIYHLLPQALELSTVSLNHLHLLENFCWFYSLLAQ
jgi:hypothetical protein